MVILPIKDKQTVRDFLEYLRGINPRDALLFQTGVNTSLRISDILRLQVKHVAYPNGEIRKYIDINEKKTGKHNRILITTPLSKVFKAYIARYLDSQDDYLFFREKGADPDKTTPITRDWASKILVAAADHQGLKYFNTQSMRKTHAYHVYMDSGKNVALVQTMLKHTSPAVTLRYLCITQDEMDEVKEIVSF